MGGASLSTCTRESRRDSRIMTPTKSPAGDSLLEQEKGVLQRKKNYCLLFCSFLTYNFLANH